MTNAKSSEMPVEELIAHYQRSIKKSQNDSKRLLHCIGKLYRMNVTVQHLQATGIGRTVNALRKNGGEVGVAAKELVSKWKEMVAAEESSDCDSESDENRQQDTEETDDERNSDIRDEKDHEKYHTPSHIENHLKSPDSVRPHKSTNCITENSLHRSNNDTSTSPKSESSAVKDKSRSHALSFKSDESENVRSSSNKHSRKDSDESKREKHHKHEKNNKHEKSNKEHHRSQKSVDKKDYTASDHLSRHENKSSNKNDEADGSYSKSHKADAKPTSSSSKRRVDGESSYNDEKNSSKRHKAEASSSTSSSKKSSKPKSSVDDDSIEIDHSMGTSFADALASTSFAYSGRSHSSKSKPSTNTSGASSSGSGSGNNNNSSTPNNGSSSSSRAGKSITSSTSSKSPALATTPPSLLTSKAKLPPLEDLSVDLPPPTIPNNYKPTTMNPMVMDYVFRQQGITKPMRFMTDEEALGASISSKTIRTKVYSGNKCAFQTVPTLHELCIRILQKNIDALEYTGGVPFEILRPILERASPDQLFAFEHYNPYLMDDSDILWEQHCMRKFRGCKRQEMETWREMYSRCVAEQEERLNNLTNNIKYSQSNAVPVKQTKLAVLDNMIKPPRSVLRKQQKFNTGKELIVSPAARVSSLSSIAPNITKSGDVRLKTVGLLRDTAQASVSNGPVKPKKAPLMQKTLQFMKGRFKR